ncbi:MAG: mycofactocin-coupled SDR family oxidoreductase [Acidimicrobiales bacterium]
MTSTDTTTETRRVAVITGAGRGIGAAIGAGLAADGWRVALLDRCADDPELPYPLATRDDLDAAVAAAVDAAGDDSAVVGLVADVRDQDGLDISVRDVVERWGRVDAGIAAAGVIAGGPPAWATDDVVWNAMIDVNLTGVWRLAKATIPAMLAAPEPRQGRFVAIASTAGMDGLPQLGAYTASKHGVIGLVKSLAAELGERGVTANAVCPGSTRTAMLDASAAIYDLASADEFAAHRALRRILEPDEIATAVAWLCSRRPPPA